MEKMLVLRKILKKTGEDRHVAIMKNSDPVFKNYKILVNAKTYRPHEFLKILRRAKDVASSVSTVVELSKALETAYQTLLYQLGLVRSGGNKKGFLKSIRKLGQDEINILKKAWKDLYAFTDNSAVVPKTIVNEIIRKVYDISPILERSTRYNVSGTLELPYYPALNDGNYDNITVGYQSEFSEITSTSGKFSTIELKGYLAGALTKISLSLINNAQFDIVNFVVNEMAYQISRFIEKELIHGTENKVAGLSTLSNP